MPSKKTYRFPFKLLLQLLWSHRGKPFTWAGLVHWWQPTTVFVKKYVNLDRILLWLKIIIQYERFNCTVAHKSEEHKYCHFVRMVNQN